MIAVLPQAEHPHLSANGEAAVVQSQFESGCFIGGALIVCLGPALIAPNQRGAADAAMFPLNQ
jgi:hypothetical protein